MRSLLRLLPLVSLATLMAHCSSSTSDPGSDPIPYMVYAGGAAGSGIAGSTSAAGATGVSGASAQAGTTGATSSTGGAGGSSSAGAPGYDITIRSVPPADTDPAIDTFLEPHVVMVRDPLPDPKTLTRPLFIHLERTGSLPLDAKLYLSQAALSAHLVIGLRYPSDVSIADLCGTDPDPACATNIRAELLDGVDHSKKVTISPANSINNRIAKLLAYLDKKYANEGWGGFLASGAPDWSKTTLSGHSLGAGQAAFIARQNAVTRVVLLAGPSDPPTATWYAGATMTPQTAYYGFLHTADPSYAAIVAGWAAVGIPDTSAPGMADGPPVLYESKDAILTSAPPTAGTSAHDAVALDSATPMVNGHAIYEPVWSRLIGPN